jgi:hypothetical protein
MAQTVSQPAVYAMGLICEEQGGVRLVVFLSITCLQV